MSGRDGMTRRWVVRRLFACRGELAWLMPAGIVAVRCPESGLDDVSEGGGAMGAYPSGISGDGGIEVGDVERFFVRWEDGCHGFEIDVH